MNTLPCGSVALILALTISSPLSAQTVSTFADGGVDFSGGLVFTGIAVDDNGTMYFTDVDNYRIYKVETDGNVTHVVGTTGGSSGDGGQATDAQVDDLLGLTVDSDGNLYLVDSSNFRVRKVDTSGIITTIAGDGTGGNSGDGGQATDAQVRPRDVAVYSNTTLYILDGSANVVRAVDLSSWIISTYAGDGSSGSSGDGGAATMAQFGFSAGIAVDSSGNLYIADSGNNAIRKVDTGGTIDTFAGQITSSGASGDGGQATDALLDSPIGVAVDGSATFTSQIKRTRQFTR